MLVKDRPITLLPVASPLHDRGSAESILVLYRSWLKGTYDVEAPLASSPDQAGGARVAGSAGVLALVVTGGTEHILGAVAAQGTPFIVMAHESMNSLPASLEAASSFNGSNVKLVLGRGRRQLAEVRRFARAARTLARIASHRIGLIGGPSPWLTYSLPDPGALKERLGIEVADVSMREFVAYHKSAKPSGRGVEPFDGAAPPASDLRSSEKIYLALRNVSERQSLTAVTPRCFDFINEFGATGCLALSKLNDEGVVAGCEGDVPSTVGMITLSEISGYPAFMANPSLIDGHRLVLAHCTVPRRLTKRVRYRTHFESGIGVALAGELRKGARVTVARYGDRYSKLRAGAGTIVRGKPWSEELCRTQVEVEMDGDAEVLMRKPMGNHLVLTYGDHVESLRHLAAVAGIQFEEM